MGLKDTCKLIKINPQYYKIVLSTEQSAYLTQDKIESLRHIAEEVNSTPDVKVVEFVGTEQYFTAGGNIEFLTSIGPDIFPELIAKIPDIILNFKPVTVANMRGHAMGGGLAIGLWSDLPCLCEGSLYGANFMSLGFTPGMGSTILLEDYFGKPLAHEMLLVGKLYKGKVLKAFGCPIACRIYPKAEHQNMVDELIKSLLEIEYTPLAMLKRTLAERRKQTFSIAVKQEVNMHRLCFSNPDTIENIKKNYLGTISDDDK